MAQGHGGDHLKHIFGTGGKCIRQALHKPYIKRTHPDWDRTQPGNLHATIDMEDVGNKGCTRRSPPHGPSLFFIQRTCDI